MNVMLIGSFILACLFASLSVICYRLGGSDVCDTKVRDIGAPLFLVLAFAPWLWPHWVGMICLFVLHFAACTPGYGGEGEPSDEQSFLYKIFKDDVFCVVGLLFGLAALPMVWLGTHLWVVIVRATLVGIGIQVLHDRRIGWFYKWGWRVFADAAEMEEILRWLIVVVTFWVLLI